MGKRTIRNGPQFVRFFGPLLEALRKLGGSATPEEAVEQIAKDLGITDAEQDERLTSGEPRFKNQVAWARFYLVRDGMLDSSKRGVWSLTDKGRATLTISAPCAPRSRNHLPASATSTMPIPIGLPAGNGKVHRRWLRAESFWL